MKLSKAQLEKIKAIIENNYHSMLISVTGKSTLSEVEIERLAQAGYDVEDKNSLLSMLYFNNLLNDLQSVAGPTSIPEMTAQQANKPEGPTTDAAVEHINENFAQLLEKHKAATQAKFEGILREYNLTERNKLLQIDGTEDEIQQLIAESNVGRLKQVLRDLSHDANRDWERVAITEVSNALGHGAMDRIVHENRGRDLTQAYGYRLVSLDSSICPHCKKFYLDQDGTPAVYKISTFLNNGTNYGKKASDWKPVAVATHPRERCSGVLQLKPGWKLLPEGGLEFIGPKAWQEYIASKIRE